MNKEQLQERLQYLDKQMQQAVANVNAIEGSIFECKFWLNKSNEQKADEPLA